MAFAVLDARHAIHTRDRAELTDVLVPAVTDDPETIEEYRHAFRRFMAPDDDQDPLENWATGADIEPHDAGICIIDLPARLIVYQSTWCKFMDRAQVTYDDVDPENPRASRWIPYSIPDDWMTTDQWKQWNPLSDQRRKQRQARPTFDARPVLWESVLEFIVDQCWMARGGSTDENGGWTPPASWRWTQLPERGKHQDIYLLDAWAELHARWLMTPREDLGGQTPRVALMAKNDHLMRQLEDRQTQWSNFGECPPALWRESQAYKLGGIGLHEGAIYYELVRALLETC